MFILEVNNLSLRLLRKGWGFTQAELASKLNVTQRTVANYESGARKPKPSTAEKIGHVFNLSIEQVWNMFYKAS